VGRVCPEETRGIGVE